MEINPNAGKPAESAMLVNVAKLIRAYYAHVPDPSGPSQRNMFGTSGHHASSLDKAFNERHNGGAGCRYAVVVLHVHLKKIICNRNKDYRLKKEKDYALFFCNNRSVVLFERFKCTIQSTIIRKRKEGRFRYQEII